MKREQAFRMVIVAAAATGLVLQYQVTAGHLASRGLGLGVTLLKLASYFTILSNALLAAVHSVALLAPESRAGRVCRGPALQGAMLLYIGVTGIVYVTMLSGLWNPQGMHWWADNLLHRMTPLLQLGFWMACVPKLRLGWKLALAWLAWPAAYLGWALARGGDYPYPFLELDRLGLGRTVLNCLLMGAGFLALGAAIVGASRYLAKGRPG
ncbi:Pr6Pr family membrane protein [Luteolibacter sp. Populi]|uniref:Pr6Pr family membrane protein n=1 Tax=Luteolibacter sp. Populi TaxID=3230487 RepID=UPI003467D843